MTAGSIFQQDFFLFQAGHPLSGEAAVLPVVPLVRRMAYAAYQQCVASDSPMTFDERIQRPAADEVPDSLDARKSEQHLEEAFCLTTEEQARALMSMAYFDKSLNRMLEEQQPLTKHDVKSAYRRILKHYHPDQSHHPITGEVVRKVNGAYNCLKPLLL